MRRQIFIGRMKRVAMAMRWTPIFGERRRYLSYGSRDVFCQEIAVAGSSASKVAIIAPRDEREVSSCGNVPMGL